VAAIFIDGNAECFGYVLDYLCTGRVVLPCNVPKAALLQDLNHYGFQSISMYNIDDSSASADALAQIVRLEEEHKRDLEKRDVKIAMLQLKGSYAIVASECFRHYIHHGISTSFCLHGNSNSDVNRCFFTSEFKKGFLNEVLATYGLKYISHQKDCHLSKNYVTLTLGKTFDTKEIDKWA